MTVLDAFAADAVGRKGEEHRYRVSADAIRAYAEATDASSDAVAPPVFAIVPAWPTIAPASRSVATDEARRRVVHYAHEIRSHRPIAPGMALVSQATPVALQQHPRGALLVIRTVTRTEDGRAVNEQLVTEFFRGLQVAESIGETSPRHGAEGGETLAEITQRIAADQADRYAAASGDDFAIHLDDGFARAVGLPGRIVHGLCTLAFAARAVLEAAGPDDPSAWRRLAVRFSAPIHPGETLTTRVRRVGGVYAFESLNAEGVAVLKDGLAELR